MRRVRPALIGRKATDDEAAFADGAVHRVFMRFRGGRKA
jgi:hypothetical protein